MAEENYNASNVTLDEIVFENRNKEYGAYDLRKNYPKLLSRAFLVGTALFILMIVTPFIVMKIKQMNEEAAVEVESNLVDVLQEDQIIETPKEKEPPPPPPPPPKEEPKIEIIQNVVPEPKKAPKVETPPPPISKQLETTTGAVAQEGVRTPTYHAPPPPPPVTGTKETTVEVKPQVSETQVYSEVEQLAEFPGGLNAFRSKVGSDFDQGVMDGDEGTVKTEVSFVVERDGSITDVQAKGSNKNFNAEAIRTVKAIRTKWKPAKINGQTVRYRYKLPVTMNFE